MQAHDVPSIRGRVLRIHRGAFIWHSVSRLHRESCHCARSTVNAMTKAILPNVELTGMCRLSIVNMTMHYTATCPVQRRVRLFKKAGGPANGSWLGRCSVKGRGIPHGCWVSQTEDMPRKPLHGRYGYANGIWHVRCFSHVPDASRRAGVAGLALPVLTW